MRNPFAKSNPSLSFLASIPRALNLVKNVADLKQMRGKSKTAKYNGTVRFKFHIASKVDSLAMSSSTVIKVVKFTERFGHSTGQSKH